MMIQAPGKMFGRFLNEKKHDNEKPPQKVKVPGVDSCTDLRLQELVD